MSFKNLDLATVSLDALDLTDVGLVSLADMIPKPQGHTHDGQVHTIRSIDTHWLNLRLSEARRPRLPHIRGQTYVSQNHSAENNCCQIYVGQIHKRAVWPKRLGLYIVMIAEVVGGTKGAAVSNTGSWCTQASVGRAAQGSGSESSLYAAHTSKGSSCT